MTPLEQAARALLTHVEWDEFGPWIPTNTRGVRLMALLPGDVAEDLATLRRAVETPDLGEVKVEYVR